MRCLSLLAAATACVLATSPAVADPTPLSEPLLTAVSSSNVSVNLTPLVSIPADFPGTGAPVAAIDYVVPAPGDPSRLFVNDTNGILYSTSTSGAAPAAYLNLNTALNGFQSYGPTDGFSGVAFAPNFDGDPTKPGYGVFYTLSSGPTAPNATLTYGSAAADSYTTTLTQWTATNPNATTFSGSSRTVMTFGDVTNGHNGGTISFNPTAAPGSADYGLLYVAMGDDGFNDPLQNGQNLSNPYGKILRIDPTQSGSQPYTIPASNPFVATAGADPAIYAYGLRNPQSFSWDSANGTMYINDIGQNSVEEVDVGKAGANYGWPLYEGTLETNYGLGIDDPNNQSVYAPTVAPSSFGITDPIAEYDHTQGYALGSGFVYEGSEIPALDGMYVMADIVSGELYYFNPNGVAAGKQAQIYELNVDENGDPISLTDLYGYDNPNLDSPRVDARLSEEADGELLLSLKSNGEVYALSSGPDISIPEPVGASVLAVAAACLGLIRIRQRGRFNQS